MKKIVFTIVMLVLVNFADAQKTEIPKNVKKAFTERFSHNPIEKVNWKKTDEGWFAVNFESYEVLNYAYFNSDGYVLENGVQIVFDDLLDEVKNSFLKKYSEDDVKSIFRIYSAVAPERNRIDIVKNGAKKSLYYSLKGNLYLEK